MGFKVILSKELKGYSGIRKWFFTVYSSNHINCGNLRSDVFPYR